MLVPEEYILLVHVEIVPLVFTLEEAVIVRHKQLVHADSFLQLSRLFQFLILKFVHFLLLFPKVREVSLTVLVCLAREEHIRQVHFTFLNVDK